MSSTKLGQVFCDCDESGVRTQSYNKVYRTPIICMKWI